MGKRFCSECRRPLPPGQLGYDSCVWCWLVVHRKPPPTWTSDCTGVLEEWEICEAAGWARCFVLQPDEEIPMCTGPFTVWENAKSRVLVCDCARCREAFGPSVLKTISRQHLPGNRNLERMAAR